ncbi:hypothetical protein B5G09_12975 [Alistipes sp. An54]|nr:hypothetical protein B5G09_12975 [Alistipes sp. An54]
MKRKIVKEAPKHQCRDCTHSYDWHEKDWKGDLFMCKCPFHTEGKYSKFLSDPQCEHFKLRGNG